MSEVFYRGRDHFLRWVAKRNNIHVPSLVADSLVQDSEEADETVLAAEQHVLETAVVGAPE